MNKHATPVSQTRPQQQADLAIEGTPPQGMASMSEPLGSHDPRTSPTHASRVQGTIKVKRSSADGDLAEQARPGHGVPSQDPDPAAQMPLDLEETEREANSALMGGGVVAGMATGAAIGVAVGGPVGVVVGATVGATPVGVADRWC